MFKNFFKNLSKKSQEIAESENVKKFIDKVEDIAEATKEKAMDVIEEIKENKIFKEIDLTYV